jgi:hypothetical protein
VGGDTTSGLDTTGCTWHTHPKEESFIVATRPVRVLLRVPSEAADLCKRQNALRAAKQAREGYFARGAAGSVSAGAQEPSEHSIRIGSSDVCFIPASWAYAVSPLEASTTDLLKVSDRKRTGETTGNVFRIGYKKYPRLSEEQSARYIAADYVVSHLDSFYRLGGNNPNKDYQ